MDFQEFCKNQPDIKLCNMINDQATDIDKDYYYMVNYQKMGAKEDKLCISMFEVDVVGNCIDPNNFIIIT